MGFNQKFKTMVIDHVNDDHRPEMRDILRGICRIDWVEDGELASFDQGGIEALGFGADGQTVRYEIRFPQALDKPKEFRPALIKMVHQARALLEDQTATTPEYTIKAR